MDRLSVKCVVVSVLLSTGCESMGIRGRIGGWTMNGSGALSADDFEDLGRVEGVEVCLEDGSGTCDTTNAHGRYRIHPVHEDQVSLSINKDGFDGGPFLIQFEPAQWGRHYYPGLIDDEGTTRLLQGSGCATALSEDDTRLLVGAPPGTKVAITPDPGVPVIYMGDEQFDPEATQISPDVDPALAYIVACGLEPDNYYLDFESTSKDCYKTSEGWTVEGHDAEVVVEGGYTTVMNWFCD